MNEPDQTMPLLLRVRDEIAQGSTSLLVVASSRSSADRLRQCMLELLKDNHPEPIWIQHGVKLGPAHDAQCIRFMSCWDLDQKARGLRAKRFWTALAAEQFQEMNRIEPGNYQP